VPVSMLLTVYEYTGHVYFYCSMALGLWWAFMSIRGFKAENEELWAKKMFIYSINYLTILFLIMVIDTVAK